MSKSGHLAWAAICFCCCAAPASASVPADSTFLSYSGTATYPHSAKFLYGERHVLAYQEGRPAERVVLYTCSDGSSFARKTVHYVDSLAPDFLLEDASNGLHEGVRSGSGGRAVFFRGDETQHEQSRLFTPAPGLVADAGFDEFVRANWQQLMTDQSVGIRFLIPSRLDNYRFQLRHLRSDRHDGVPVEVFRLELAGIGSWLLPRIDVYYSAGEHVLVHYEGLSDLRDASHSNIPANITFHLADRTPSDRQAYEEALRAPLARCNLQ